MGGGGGGARGGGVGVVWPPVVPCAIAGVTFFHITAAVRVLAVSRNVSAPKVM